jgi:hypothetical protein
MLQPTHDRRVQNGSRMTKLNGSASSLTSQALSQLFEVSFSRLLDCNGAVDEMMQQVNYELQVPSKAPDQIHLILGYNG